MGHSYEELSDVDELVQKVDEILQYFDDGEVNEDEKVRGFLVHPVNRSEKQQTDGMQDYVE